MRSNKLIITSTDQATDHVLVIKEHKSLLWILMVLLLPLCANAQQSPEQLVRDYVSKLDDFLMSPNSFEKRAAFENATFLQGCYFKDDIYIKYKKDSRIEDCMVKDYAGIISDAINANNRYSYANVKIARDLSKSSSDGIYAVTAYLQYSGAIEMRTVTVFHIKNGKILGLTNDFVKTKEWNADDSPKPDPPTSGSHQYVDLGIGTLWATTNVGADNPWEYGDYFVWGETDGKKSTYYWWDNYKYCRDGDYHKFTKYCSKSDYGYNGFTDRRTTLEKSDDAATVNWGSEWRMPTIDDCYDLNNKCYWVWTTNYKGHKCNGYIVYKALKESDKGVEIVDGGTADAAYSPNRVAHIFLPTAGLKCKDRTISLGIYWSSSYDAGSSDSGSHARALDFDSTYVRTYYSFLRCCGGSVRPVRCKN